LGHLVTGRFVIGDLRVVIALVLSMARSQHREMTQLLCCVIK
jgi:hypothetical protein